MVTGFTFKNSDGDRVLSLVFDAFSKVDVHSFLLNEGFEVYDNHSFMQFLKDVYAKYMSSDEDEKLKINCSMRVLFRDLYDYNPDLS